MVWLGTVGPRARVVSNDQRTEIVMRMDRVIPTSKPKARAMNARDAIYQSRLALLRGALLAALALVFMISTAGSSRAADEKGPFYLALDTLTVQFEHAQCKRTILAVNLEIEYTQADKQSQIHAYRPKIMSLLFAALDDHLAEAKKAKRAQVQKIAKRVVQKALGKKLVTDVLVAQMMLQK